MSESVTLITGSMFGKKSKILMDLIKASHDGEDLKYLVFKPTSDTRDGLYVKSRVYERVVPALAWDQNYEDMRTIFNYTISGFALTNPDEIKTVFFDETHFLSYEDTKFIMDTCKKYGVSLVFAGLETSFKLEYFDSVKFIKQNCDAFIFCHGDCNGCGESNAIYNILYDNNGNIVKEGQSIQPGDLEYKVFCEKCLVK
jgi:thymidine kinase